MTVLPFSWPSNANRRNGSADISAEHLLVHFLVTIVISPDFVRRVELIDRHMLVWSSLALFADEGGNRRSEVPHQHDGFLRARNLSKAILICYAQSF
jgi:hypothetical protein